MEKIIQYFGQNAKVNCDENCKKAFGSNSRPRVYNHKKLEGQVFGLNGTSIYPTLEENDIDVDDWAYLSDDELPDAPIDTGFYEGGQSKPVDENGNPVQSQIPNKWCVRECERCNMSRTNQWMNDLPVRKFYKRFFNIAKSEKSINS